MARDAAGKRYQEWYARLLQLYPRSYRRQFAEPMQQTFADMCYEHQQASGNMFGFALKAYADTGLGIIKEHAKETIMQSKSTKSKQLIAAASVSLLAIAVTGVLLLNNRQPSTIPPGSYLKQVREISSKNKKEACLAEDQQARTAVQEDDKPISEDYDGTYFEMAASAAIADVPAGTNFELTINSYDGTLAKGTLTYEKDYGTYNYTTKKLAGPNEWELVSFAACIK